MIAKTRETSAGTEYWDNDEMRVRFVPKGQEPDFEVTENPKSMLKNKEEPKEQKSEDVESVTASELEAFGKSMTIPKLKEYAEENGIELPADVKKKDDIVQYLNENLSVDDVE